MKKLILSIIILITLLWTSPVLAFTPLDRILEYDISVTKVYDDATLDLEYHIKWEVLNSSKEGPLEWVKIGVPNRFVSNIRALSNNISDIHYSSDDGAFIRVDFDKSYYEGSVVEFSFSFHQERFFTYDKDNKEVQYRFTPGWFEEIEVDRITVSWPKDNILETNANKENGTFYIWEYSLDFNETINCDVRYDDDYFVNMNLKKQWDPSTEDPTGFIIFVVFLVAFFVVIFIIIYVINRSYGGGYYYYRGYSGNRYYHHWYHFHHHGINRRGETIEPPKIVNSGSSSGGGHSCACACACACAGGGRAGCSRKDFTYCNHDIIIEKLKNN